MVRKKKGGEGKGKNKTCKNEKKNQYGTQTQGKHAHYTTTQAHTKPPKSHTQKNPHLKT